MAVFKCKMCGGQLEITEGASVCTCEYCGAQQTLPKVMDENLQSLFNRANALRMKAEFDKASEIYEKILQASGTEAEAYWGLILCKYGIEYVEDPTTYKRVPTCHRASFDAVTADDDFKMALQYADPMQKSVYEAEAKQIDEIQKGIIALAQKEDPYDVFICYKETDENGKRTQDSVIANDIYYQLTQEGYKVFYAAITLEDKLGQEYEPYIFSALNSARVMLSIGTKPEYFNAVWVKNEWSRFLKIMKKDRARMLIPCYRDMDAYELPEEFAHLQAQDMSKIGFINDIVRGIKKVIVKEEAKPEQPEQVVVQQTVAAPMNSNVVALLKRGNMALEDGEWEKADDFFEEVLNQDAECAEAYVGKLLAKYKAKSLDRIKTIFFDKYDETESEELLACEEAKDRIESAVKQYTIADYLSEADIRNAYVFDRKYESVLNSRALQKENTLETLEAEKLFVRAKQYATGDLKTQIEKMVAELTAQLDGLITDAKWEDEEAIASITSAYERHLAEADAKVKKLFEDASARREATYESRVKGFETAKEIADYEAVKKNLLQMNGYKESAEYIKKCDERIAKIKAEQAAEEERLEAARRKEAERAAKKKKNVMIVAGAMIAICICVLLVITKVIIPANKYKEANRLLENKEYVQAYETLNELGKYKDCYELKESIKEEYKRAKFLSAKRGDTVILGAYNSSNEWIVLDVQSGKLLLLSKYAIDKRIYNTAYEDITWEKCTLRSWLNGTYLNSAFSSEEQKLIVNSSIMNKTNSEYGTTGGNNTTDKVFLLSIDEVNTYFDSDSARQCTLTDGTSVWWWLRSPGYYSVRAAGVYSDGSVDYDGDYVHNVRGAVRPALWIDISNL